MEKKKIKNKQPTPNELFIGLKQYSCNTMLKVTEKY